MIPLARPLLDAAEEEAVAEVLRSGWLVQGPRVAAFEEALAGVIGCRHVVCCSSGTAALQLALGAVDLPPGSRVAVPAYTFPATINSVLLAGLRPVLMDIDPGTFNVPASEFDRVRSGVDAFMPVHQFGQPARLDGLTPDDPVFEDAACALGASLDGRAAGTLGRVGCFSFHPRKIITTGEGGAVSTDDDGLADRLRRLRNHGMGLDPDGARSFTMAGWNFRMSEMHAAIGLVQVGRLEGLLADRRRIAAGYSERLGHLRGRGLELPAIAPGVVPTWQSYVVRVPDDTTAATVIGSLREKGVQASIGAQALRAEPAYRDLPGCSEPMPGASDAMLRAVALPVPPGLTDNQLDRVAEALRTSIH